MRRRAAFGALLFVALCVALAFLTLPIVAIFVDTSPAELIRSLGEPDALDALWLSLKTSLAALAIIVVVGTPAAYLLATREFRGRSIVMTLIELPLVLPPAVAGIALLACFGPKGLFGSAIEDAGIALVLQTAGVIVALTFVAAPFYLRQAQEAFAAVDRNLLDAARTLGASEARAFARVAVPCAGQGITAGLALAWGRALGEFGATLMFAGSFPGITQTVPLAIFARFSSDFTSALALSAVLVIVSAALLLSVKLLGRSPLLGWRSGVSALEVSARDRLRGLELEVDLRIEDRACVAIVGPSGAGKSTVLRIVAGLRRPDSGRVVVGEEVWLDSRRGVDLLPEQRSCGFMFQEYALFPHLSAWRNVAFGISAPRDERRGRALELLERFGIGELADARPGSISGGERQRVALARALARDPGSAAARRAAVGARRPHPGTSRP